MKCLRPVRFGLRVFAVYSLLSAEEPVPPLTSLPELVVVPATRLGLSAFDQPYAFFQHTRVDLNQGVGRTALERIDFGPGVAMQQTGPSQTSPYIRGLTGKQSLLLFNGIRLSHAAMRGGPNEYSALIPDMSLGGVDVILGSSSAVNGSDGLTGALDLRLAPAGRGVQVPASPWIGGRIDSANGRQVQTGLDGRQGPWRYSVEVSQDEFHDRITGRRGDRNIFGPGRDAYRGVPNTAYSQWAAAGRAAFDGWDDRSQELALGHTRQEDARRPDGYFENSGRAERISRFYDPTTFSYVHLRDLWVPGTRRLDSLTHTVWWHQFREDQIREDLAGGGRIYRRRENDDRIDSLGWEIQATTLFGNRAWTYGATVLHERTRNDFREFRNPAGPEAADARPHQPERWAENTTITDGATYRTYAIFLQDLWQVTDAFTLLTGVRYSYVTWDFDVADGSADDVSGGLRATYRLTDSQQVFAGLSKAFRAPNLNDLDGATDRGSSGTLAFGNPDLRPELSYTAEIGWRYQSGRDQVALSLFYTELEDLIQSVFPESGGAGMMQNAESGYLRGGELMWDVGLPWSPAGGKRLALIGAMSLVDSEVDVPQADGSVRTEPISRANRVFGRVGLHYDLDAHWWFRAQTRFHDAYSSRDVTAADRNDVRHTVPGNPDGSLPGYALVDLSAGWNSLDGDRWLSLTLENLGDKTYRPLGSGADGAGRNLVLAGGFRF